MLFLPADGAVTVRWLLRIDFVVSSSPTDPPPVVAERTASYTVAVPASKLHTLHWELPLDVRDWVLSVS